MDAPQRTWRDLFGSLDRAGSRAKQRKRRANRRRNPYFIRALFETLEDRSLLDGLPVVTLGVADAIATEEDADPPSDLGQFTISRTGDTSAALLVVYEVGGTAESTDYDLGASSTGATIPPGASSVTIDVIPEDDTIDEPLETVMLRLVASAEYEIFTPPPPPPPPGGPPPGTLDLGWATVNIVDDDPSFVWITASDSDSAEAGPNPGEFTVHRFAIDLTQSLTVHYYLGGTASGSDYQADVNGSVVIPAGETSASFDLVPIQDGLVEPQEAVEAFLAADPSDPDTYFASQESAIVFIASELSIVSLGVADADASEIGLDPGVFTIERVNHLNSAFTVGYTVSGTANGNDYSLSGTAYFDTMEASVNITVAPLADNLVEADETVIFTLTPGYGYDLGIFTSGTVTITDGTPTVSLSVSDDLASEVGPDPGSFTLTRAGNAQGDLTVNYQLGGTATGSDYSLDSVTIPSGADSVVIDVTPIADLLLESPETVELTILAGATYYLGSPTSGAVTIADGTPTVSIAASGDASEIGPAAGAFTVSRIGGDTSQDLTVNFTVGGTADSQDDYAEITSIVIPGGSTSVDVPVQPLIDALVEGSETVVITLSASSAYLVSSNDSATVDIADDPPIVTIAATGDTAREDDESPGTFVITRTGGDHSAALAVSVTIGGTASEGDDYVELATFTIPAGESGVTISVTPLKDNDVEDPDETVVLTLGGGGTLYTLGQDTTATVTIIDDPPVVSIEAADPNAAEEDLDPATLLVTRTGGDLTEPLAVNLTIGGSAGVPNDYTVLMRSGTRTRSGT